MDRMEDSNETISDTIILWVGGRVNGGIEMEIENHSKRHEIAAGQNIKERDYWLEKLSGELVKTVFPYDRNKPGSDSGDSGTERSMEKIMFKIEGELYSSLDTLSNNSDVRLYISLVSALILLLDRYTASGDIIIGAPIYKQEIEGDFVNTVLVLRNRVSVDMSFKQLLMQTAKTVFEASEHQNYPFGHLTL